MIDQSISKASSIEVSSYLSFGLGDELFAIPVGKVLEILELTKITKVPKSPANMRGVINLRGSVLPVIDARNKFGMPRVEQTVNTCIIVLSIQMEGEIIAIGAQVDSVQEVLEIEPGQIQPAPRLGSKYKSEFIEGMIKKDQNFIMLLHIDNVLSTEELVTIQETNLQDHPKTSV